ncbi:hypothetical protein VTO73DRAFT_2165 [Trametes versicolor]
MPRGTLQPLELAPEWLTNSPVTADDFRCLTPASTIFRMSFGARSHSNPRESVMSMESDDEESDASTFLWDDEESESEDDADTIEEPEATPVAQNPEPSPQPQALPTPAHSRAPSTESLGKRKDRAIDFRLPWFMQVDPVCLATLDDQLLQSPMDAFADLCYAQAVRASDIPTGEEQTGHSYGYSWRRLSRLLSACPDVTQVALGLDGPRSEPERESESESDTDSEQLASPEQHAPAPGWGFSVYQPKSEREQSESPYRPYTSQTLIAKPLPALPAYEPEPPRTPPSCSPPPLRPSEAVTQAQLAFLFAGSPPRAGESVHFFPTKEHQPPKRGRSRRGTLRISTSAADGGGGGGGSGPTTPWSPRLGIFQRGLAGLRAGLSH